MENPMGLEDLVAQLHQLASPDTLAKQQHFGIVGSNRLGISMPELHKLAKGHRNHELALKLWQTGIHEARLLAPLVDESVKVTREQMEAWVQDFNSWDLCDNVCLNLFYKPPFATEYALIWVEREEEFTRRAGFVLMVEMAMHLKKMPDDAFHQFFPLMVQYANDDRNFVRKAVNWALRGIAKSRPALKAEAIETAKQISLLDSPSARWIAADALKELNHAR
jgi:3-methyladenine DNA glycosylase AlkD